MRAFSAKLISTNVNRPHVKMVGNVLIWSDVINAVAMEPVSKDRIAKLISMNAPNYVLVAVNAALVSIHGDLIGKIHRHQNRIASPQYTILSSRILVVNAVNTAFVDAVVIWKILAYMMCVPMAASALKIALKWPITIAIAPANLQAKIAPTR